jgi:hypothetical protein
MSHQMSPYHRDTPVVNADRKMTQPWQRWMDEALIPRLERIPLVVGSYEHTDPLDATLPVTGLTNYDTEGGTLRLTYALRLTRVATTSSGVSATISWTENGLTRSFTTASLAANTIDQLATGVILITSDPGTPVTVAATYVSVGATPMQYALDVFAERMP